MKKSTIILLSIALATAIVVPTIVYANSPQFSAESQVDLSNENIEETGPIFSGDPVTPSIIANNFSGTASGSKQTASAFVVPINYGHVKLYFLNNSSAATTISVTNIKSGLVYFTKQVNAGSSYTWRSIDNYANGMQSGDYTVTYRSSAANVNVNYSGFASNNAKEVAN
ncbi:hypothetical protein [Paenibacillus campi]|uniref:hypothetical protein n=1 Tax=Paenibacillus campi TaxID=3106031 RepID=UPI002AFED704|nr:hypothetical protein [Paenibacillus sp. SGZ-1009]